MKNEDKVEPGNKSYVSPRKWKEAMDKLPSSVPKPAKRPINANRDMTCDELHTRVKFETKTKDVRDTLEYSEICYRLITWTVDELAKEGQLIPRWKQNPA